MTGEAGLLEEHPFHSAKEGAGGQDRTRQDEQDANGYRENDDENADEAQDSSNGSIPLVTILPDHVSRTRILYPYQDNGLKINGPFCNL